MMKLRSPMLLAAAVPGLLALAFLRIAPPAVASDQLAATAVVPAFSALAGDDSVYTYVGSKKCKKCHLKEYKSWAKTKMGQAFEILKPGQSSEAKTKANLDVAKDYTTDETCLKCHTVGYGKPGGYAVPPAGDKKAARKAKSLEGVGCESCHGPGSEYGKVFDEIMKSKRKYKVEELYAVGMHKVDESTCKACHNGEGPTTDPSTPFDYAKQKDEGTHENFDLKQREE